MELHQHKLLVPNPNSTMHYQSSINNNPNLPGGYPSPSNLDLDGVTPAKYLDNPPG